MSGVLRKKNSKEVPRMGSICIKNVVEHLGHFNGIIPSLGCILIKQHGVRGEKFL